MDDGHHLKRGAGDGATTKPRETADMTERDLEDFERM
jgi:hypothetical protein